MSRIVIFANGLMSNSATVRTRLQPADRIFCADGGTRHALLLGLTPDAVIGDLDSLPSEVIAQVEAAGIPIFRHPVAKDQTDLELAVQLALEEEPDEILLVTALGGRLDQMLANILLLTRPEYAGVRLTLADGPQLATLLRDHQSMTIEGQPGDTLSLVPLTAAVTGVTLTGVEWPLQEATLFLGSTLSISNTLTGHQATLRLGKGMVLVVQVDKDKEDLLR